MKPVVEKRSINKMQSFLENVFQQHRNRILLRFSSGEVRTYKEVWETSGKKCVEWQQGKTPFEFRPVILQRGNSEKWIIDALAAWRLNAQLIPLAKHEHLFERIKEIQPCYVSSDHLVSSGKNSTERYDSPLVLYTSGSLGSGKQVVFSSENVLTNIEQIDSVVGEDTVNSEDVSFSMLPWSHSYGLTCELLFLMSRGASLFIPDPKKPIKTQFLMARPTLLFTVPYFLEKSIQYPDWIKMTGLARFLLGGRLKSVSVGGAPCPPQVIQQFKDSYRTNVFQGYGMTEASPMISLNTLSHNKPGTVGRPLPGINVRFSDQGEILVSGKNVSSFLSPDRYLQIGHQQFLKTGDKGYLDEEGYLVVEERLADHFKLANGLFVHSRNIEQLYKDKLGLKVTDRLVLLPHPFQHNHCFFVCFYKNKLSFSSDVLEKIGTQNGLSPHEIPKAFYWIDENRLQDFCTPKFTIKKGILSEYVRKHL